MILIDVNVLVYAHRQDTTDHHQYRGWLETVLNGDEAFGVSELVMSGVVRVLTHRRVFKQPTPLAKALQYVDTIRGCEHAVAIAPGPRHWGIFQRLLRQARAHGNLVPDAYYAALAIESGCEWITTDGDFARFRGLRWRHPLHR